MSVPGGFDLSRMRPCFVGGVARSGTSLLKSLLDGHPQVMQVPGESFAIEWFDAPDPVAAYLELSNLRKFHAPDSDGHGAMERELRSRLSGPTDLHGALTALYESCAAIWPPAPEVTVWVEKTPRHVRVFPALLSAFGPRARAVVVTRDPRATMASQQKRWSRSGPAAVRAFCRRWAAVDRLARAYARQRTDVLVVAYEDLVRDAEGPMKRIAEALGLDWDPVLLQATRQGEAWAGNSSFGDKASGVADHSLRRWEQTLTAEDVAMVERLLRDPMRARGDELVTDGRSGTWERLGFQAAALRTTWRARQDCRRAQRKQR